jgi:glycosyltransferase involved in cell wall biosynthesis
MRLRDRVARLAGGSDSRQALLFISPVVPSLFGNGLAMRAAYSLLALATRYRVSLVVLPVHGSPAGREIPEQISSACKESRVLATPERAVTFPAGRFDVVHVFRLGTVPHAEPWLKHHQGKARLWLDLDDVESLVHRRLAQLHRTLDEERLADEEELLARDAESREVVALMRFDRVLLASAQDLERLPLHGAADIRILPNVLPSTEPLPSPPEGNLASLLFVGTLGYFPNVEGATWFAQDVLPLIRQRTRRAVELTVVGMGWLPQVAELHCLPGVRVIGNVADIRPFYGRANVVVVPLRAGGGTRIKVIEAFGLGRPAVSTSIGVEGIDARDGEHVLIADDAAAFADACLKLLDDPSLGMDLTRRARDLARDRYSPEVLAEVVAGWP